MFQKTLLVIMLINCVKGVETPDNEIPPSTLELMLLAQCEARCYNMSSGWREHIDKNNTVQKIIAEKFNNLDITSKKVPRSVLESQGPSSPYLHCREADMINIKWEFSNSQTSVFVLEMQDEEQQTWKSIRNIQTKLATLRGLKSNMLYQFRIRAITSDGQIGNAALSEWISTLNDIFQPQPVTNISIVNVTSKPESNLLQITVSWIPAEDRTCYYEVVCWDNTFLPKQKYISEPQDFAVSLNNLKLGSNYSVSIMGKSMDEMRESTKSWLNFTTQDCLEYYNNDLTKCVPPKPTNLTVEEELVTDVSGNISRLYNVYVSWATPELLPSRHEVELVRLEPDACLLVRQNTTGNMTWVTFTAVEVESQYEVIVKAVSKAGYSDYASVVRTSFSKNKSKTNTDYDGGGWNVKYLWLMVFLPVVLLIVLAGICLFVCHQNGKRIRHERRCQYIETRERKPSLRTEYSGSVECGLDYNAEWEIPRENLLLGDVLGEGAFGIVRKGVLQEGDTWRDVAVKMLRDEPSTEDLRQFKQEINVMQSVGRHPHIVSLIGCCTRSGRLRLVVEYCAEGDLLNFLRKHWNDLVTSSDKRGSNNNESSRLIQPVKYAELLSQESTSDAESINPLLWTVTNKMYDIVNAGDDSAQHTKMLTPADLLSFARQIAIGMEYLANNRVVHRDLAARNVLVCSDKTVKISDFGLSRDIYEENIYRKKGSGRLPVKWMALESLLHQVYTTQSDVWSFGVLLWEIVTLGGNPYPGIPTNKLFGLLKEGYRMECPSNCKKELYDIMLACWQSKPRDRPTFTDLHKMLDHLLETSTSQKYLNLNLVNFKSDIKSFNQDGQRSRNNGGYLNSDSSAVDTSETFIPASPFLKETSHQYLNTTVRMKYDKMSS